MKPQRVLALVHKGLEPPDEKVDKTTAQTAEWRMEYDVVRTLKVLGHEMTRDRRARRPHADPHARWTNSSRPSPST